MAEQWGKTKGPIPAKVQYLLFVRLSKKRSNDRVHKVVAIKILQIFINQGVMDNKLFN